jgi:hypothetical protein
MVANQLELAARIITFGSAFADWLAKGWGLAPGGARPSLDEFHRIAAAIRNNEPLSASHASFVCLLVRNDPALRRALDDYAAAVGHRSLDAAGILGVKVAAGIVEEFSGTTDGVRWTARLGGVRWIMRAPGEPIAPPEPACWIVTIAGEELATDFPARGVTIGHLDCLRQTMGVWIRGRLLSRQQAPAFDVDVAPAPPSLVVLPDEPMPHFVGGPTIPRRSSGVALVRPSVTGTLAALELLLAKTAA